MGRSAAWLLALVALPALARAEGEAGPCDIPRAEQQLGRVMALGELSDVHYTAQAIVAVCPPSPEVDRIVALDGIALVRLEELERGRNQLLATSQSSDVLASERARIAVAWSYAREGDDEAFVSALARVPARARPRLAAYAAIGDDAAFATALAGVPATPPELELLRHEHAAYQDARHERRPWLAGVLSTILPGAGQIYAGSWAAAGVTFVLNAVFIGATVELVRDERYLTATATGLAASFFYVGGILNAVDLADRRNDNASRPHHEALERQLVPEAWGH